MTSMTICRAERLQEFDIEGALVAGLERQGSARTQLFATAVLAAGLHAENLGMTSFQIKALAGRVRSQGLPLISALPEELLGQSLPRSVRAWLTAAARATAPPEPGTTPDGLVAQWLDAIAVILSARADQRTRRRAAAAAVPALDRSPATRSSSLPAPLSAATFSSEYAQQDR